MATMRSLLGTALVALLLQTTRAFAPPTTTLPSTPTGRLHISLEDSWSSIADVVGDPTEIVEKVDWNKLLAPKAWAIDHVQETVASLWMIYRSLPLWQEVGVVLLPSFLIFFSILYKLAHPPSDFRNGYEPYTRGNYDPLAARVYYAQYPKIVIERTLQLLRFSNTFIFNILLDKYVWRDEEGNRQERANELLQLVQNAGPTAIKIGQALSVRPDLIPLEYADTLATLQDKVPPFSSSAAREILSSELGERKMATIKNLNFQQGPVASASIGQVYKCTANSQEVAIKVQRPNVLSEIALDLYIVREFAPIYAKIVRSATDFQGLVDEWGKGFIAELDYHTEASNTKRFNVEMKKRKLTSVTAPVVVDDFSTDCVLTTQWVDGCRLDESTANDVPRLCSVALNAYLVMLLELQSLHCDPHPGNLLRGTDGRLCILDWGMTVETDPDLQYSLLEFVAHLTSQDYDQVPEDLVKLGFLKADRLESVKSSGFLEPLVYFLKQAQQGGGGEKVRERIFDEFRERYPGMEDEELRVQMRADMQQQMEEVRKRESAVTGITIEVEELQKRNRDAFTIPPWFLYTSRAFLTLEGVSLQADEDFSIIQSCFPYVAKRLVGDDSPRAQKALRDLLYGAGDFLDAERVSDLADGFSRYTTSTKSVNQEIKRRNEGIEIMVNDPDVVDPVRRKSIDRETKIAETEAALTLAKDSADILLASEGNLVQNILIDESALAASANVKDALRNTLVDGPKRFRESLPVIGSILPPSPLEKGVAPFLKKTTQEENAQDLIGKISKNIPLPSPPTFPSGSIVDGIPFATATTVTGVSSADSSVDLEQTAIVAKEVRENLPKYAPLVGQLGGKFASTLLKTASSNIDTTLDEMDHSGDEQDQLIKAAAMSLSQAASRGADAILQRINPDDR